MKKLIVIGLSLAIALVSEAAAFNWKYVAGATEKDTTVYVLLGAAESSFENLAAVTSKAAASGVIAKVGPNYTTNGSVVYDKSIAEITDTSYYYVLVNKENTGYWISDQLDANAYLYEPPVSGTYATLTNKSAITYTDFAPEPTSGLLMVLGGALLALRRKKK